MKRSILVTVLFVAGCGSTFQTRVPSGEWGGRNVDLQVGLTGATATFKCGATGATTAPLVLDDAGRFQASGSYQSRLVQGGPRPAQYSGSLNGSVMKLTVRLDDGTLGPFSLEIGQPGTFEVCNF